jgi:hypothetical protein
MVLIRYMPSAVVPGAGHGGGASLQAPRGESTRALRVLRRRPHVRSCLHYHRHTNTACLTTAIELDYWTPELECLRVASSSRIFSTLWTFFGALRSAKAAYVSPTQPQPLFPPEGSR